MRWLLKLLLGHTYCGCESHRAKRWFQMRSLVEMKRGYNTCLFVILQNKRISRHSKWLASFPYDSIRVSRKPSKTRHNLRVSMRTLLIKFCSFKKNVFLWKCNDIQWNFTNFQGDFAEFPVAISFSLVLAKCVESTYRYSYRSGLGQSFALIWSLIVPPGNPSKVT